MLGNIVCVSDGWVSKGKPGVTVKAAKDISIRGLHRFILKPEPVPEIFWPDLSGTVKCET